MVTFSTNLTNIIKSLFEQTTFRICSRHKNKKGRYFFEVVVKKNPVSRGNRILGNASFYLFYAERCCCSACLRTMLKSILVFLVNTKKTLSVM